MGLFHTISPVLLLSCLGTQIRKPPGIRVGVGRVHSQLVRIISRKQVFSNKPDYKHDFYEEVTFITKFIMEMGNPANPIPLIELKEDHETHIHDGEDAQDVKDNQSDWEYLIKIHQDGNDSFDQKTKTSV